MDPPKKKKKGLGLKLKIGGGQDMPEKDAGVSDQSGTRESLPIRNAHDVMIEELNKIAPDVKKGKVVLQNFLADPKSLNPGSMGTDGGVESSSDMSITSQDATTTVVYQKGTEGMPEMEESKGLEDVPMEAVESEILEGNRELASEDGSKMEIQLSDLKVVGALGQGASGFVEKCFHKPTKTRIALKKIPVDSTEKVKAQLILELKTLHQCDSDYIVRSYGSFIKSGCVHIALEYMDVGSLEDVKKAVGTLPEDILGLMTI